MASSSRSQVVVQATCAAAYMTGERPSVSVRWRPLSSVVVVTHLVTRLRAASARPPGCKSLVSATTLTSCPRPRPPDWTIEGPSARGSLVAPQARYGGNPAGGQGKGLGRHYALLESPYRDLTESFDGRRDAAGFRQPLRQPSKVARAAGRPTEKRKVGSSILPLTTSQLARCRPVTRPNACRGSIRSAYLVAAVARSRPLLAPRWGTWGARRIVPSMRTIGSQVGDGRIRRARGHPRFVAVAGQQRRCCIVVLHAGLLTLKRGTDAEQAAPEPVRRPWRSPPVHESGTVLGPRLVHAASPGFKVRSEC